MKIKGKSVEPPKPIPIVIPRGEESILLYAQPLMDFEEFDLLYPEPNPPYVTKPGKQPYPDFKDKAYLKKMEDYGTAKLNYTIIKSLSMGTEGLEWEKIDVSNPETWLYLEEELRSIFSVGEVSHIFDSVIDAARPSEERCKEALRRFMSPQEEEQNPSTFQMVGRNSTQSGEPANG